MVDFQVQQFEHSTQSCQTAGPSSRPEELNQTLLKLVPIENIAFPQFQYLPPADLKLRCILAVSLDVALELREPVILTGLGQSSVHTSFVLVPETAVHEDHLPAGWEDEVWNPR